MDKRPPPLWGILLLGTTLLLLGGLLWLWAGEQQRPSGPAQVQERIEAPDHSLIFFGDPLHVPAERATVLGALIEGSQAGNFTVEVTYAYGGQAFVRSIAGHPNSGTCGWVWDLNGKRGDRAADLQPVRDQDHVLWHWDCTG